MGELTMGDGLAILSAQMESSTQGSYSGTEQGASTVGFPSHKPVKKGNKKKRLFLILGFILILVILGGIWFVLSDSQTEIEPTPTPFVESLNSFDQVAEPTATPESTEVDKGKIVVEILNGTGKSGEAGFLQDKLKALGYTKIEVGNATSQNNISTTVTFSSSLAKEVVDEITKELKGIYQKVETKNSSTVDGVQIITGLRVGQSASTSTPSASPSPTVTPTPTPTPTPQ